ncbi:hypothetical protein [Kitasatospora sp. NPDC085879]|uniref:hypothetical protein n=1 Tax=Kitasatospora sp. NPDC085879 TaxID=3154769 RepID=UPI0034288789
MVLIGAVMTGCAPAAGPGQAPGISASSAAGTVIPALTEAQAQDVFERFARESVAAQENGDSAALGEVEGGPLLEESQADGRLRKARGDADAPRRYVRPTYLIPQAAPGQPAPRAFAVLSKVEGKETDRSSYLIHFTRAADGGKWKAVASAWVLTEAPVRTASPAPSPSPKEGVITVRPEVMPPLAREASGAVGLSAAPAAASGVCGHYAQYLSFTVPAGRPDSPDFERGDFTSKLVDYFNGWNDDRLQRTFSYRAVGGELPVFRLDNGDSLVTCTLEGTHRVRGATPANWINLNAGSDSDTLLGGGARKWASLEEVWAVTAVVEVPQDGSPAKVLATDAYGATKLSVKGVEWK